MANAWHPASTKQDKGSRPLIEPVGLVLHTAVASASNLPPSGDTKWNWYLNREGKLYQYYAANEATAAHVDGNRWNDNGVYKGFLALESWDGYGTSVWPASKANSDPGSGPKWNDEQVEEIIELIVWLHKEWDIPIVKATGVHGVGIGYHSQYLRPKPQKRWTSSHACPGRARIAQVPGIIAEAKKRAAVVSKPPVKEVDVTPADIEAIADRAAEKVWFERLSNPLSPAGSVAPHASEYQVAQGNKMDALGRKVDDLTDLVNELLARGN